MAEPNLPGKLRDLLASATWLKDGTGHSGASVWRLTGPDGAAVWMKTEAAGGELEREAAVLKWLHSRLPAPRVLWHGVEHGREWLLLSELPGRDLTRLKDPEVVVKVLASGLKKLHTLDVRGCPFSAKLDYKLREAKKRVDAGLVDKTDFEPACQGLTAFQVWEKVLAERPDVEDIVFTHGDCCLPNVFENNRDLSGFVDWGRAGLADRYQDLALAARSLDHNLGSGPWSDKLFREYGIQNPDRHRVNFYIMLDELF